MIGSGAAFTFALLAGIIGIFIGAAISEHWHKRHRDEAVRKLIAQADEEWGDIDRAATAAYYGAHGDPGTRGPMLGFDVWDDGTIDVYGPFDQARMDEAAADIGQARHLTLEEAADAVKRAW